MLYQINVYVIVGSTCPAKFHSVGDQCMYVSNNTVSSSRLCGDVCGDGMPAEISSTEQRDAVQTFLGSMQLFGPFYLGTYLSDLGPILICNLVCQIANIIFVICIFNFELFILCFFIILSMFLVIIVHIFQHNVRMMSSFLKYTNNK